MTMVDVVLKPTMAVLAILIALIVFLEGLGAVLPSVLEALGQIGSLRVTVLFFGMTITVLVSFA